jgi:hypothetical protein
MNNETVTNALVLLRQALMVATESGALDELLVNCKSPDSINDLCDAVAIMLDGD